MPGAAEAVAWVELRCHLPAQGARRMRTADGGPRTSCGKLLGRVTGTTGGLVELYCEACGQRVTWQL